MGSMMNRLNEMSRDVADQSGGYSWEDLRAQMVAMWEWEEYVGRGSEPAWRWARWDGALDHAAQVLAMAFVGGE